MYRHHIARHRHRTEWEEIPTEKKIIEIQRTEIAQRKKKKQNKKTHRNRYLLLLIHILLVCVGVYVNIYAWILAIFSWAWNIFVNMWFHRYGVLWNINHRSCRNKGNKVSHNGLFRHCFMCLHKLGEWYRSDLFYFVCLFFLSLFLVDVFVCDVFSLFRVFRVIFS